MLVPVTYFPLFVTRNLEEVTKLYFWLVIGLCCVNFFSLPFFCNVEFTVDAELLLLSNVVNCVDFSRH